MITKHYLPWEAIVLGPTTSGHNSQHPPAKMFFCSISGEPPQDPVVSQKSGHVYERKLILKYITENGTDPITGEKLEESDLITVKASAYLLHMKFHTCLTSQSQLLDYHIYFRP